MTKSTKVRPAYAHETREASRSVKLQKVRRKKNKEILHNFKEPAKKKPSRKGKTSRSR
jgi:hypothetical protein